MFFSPLNRCLLAVALLAASAHAEEDLCAQPSPEEMAQAAGVTLPKRPWHLANIWWDFTGKTEHFESLAVDVTIDRDVPSSYNLYIAPVGVGYINGMQFYGGIQTNINGWASKESRERIFPGKGGIFSRWSNDKTTPIGLEHVRVAAPECLQESAGYEGEFASVRRPFAWGKGTYTYEILKRETVETAGKAHTWFEARIIAPGGAVSPIGSVSFEGTDFTFWEKHSAFVEVYSTSKIPKSGIPKVKVTFGWPRLNGKKAPLKKASAFYPHTTGPAAPDCAWVTAEGESCVVEVGPIFQRDEAKRRHPVELVRGE